jgi:hypothetical protein
LHSITERERAAAHYIEKLAEGVSPENALRISGLGKALREVNSLESDLERDESEELQDEEEDVSFVVPDLGPRTGESQQYERGRR